MKKVGEHCSRMVTELKKLYPITYRFEEEGVDPEEETEESKEEEAEDKESFEEEEEE